MLITTVHVATWTHRRGHTPVPIVIQLMRSGRTGMEQCATCQSFTKSGIYIKLKVAGGFIIITSLISGKWTPPKEKTMKPLSLQGLPNWKDSMSRDSRLRDAVQRQHSVSTLLLASTRGARPAACRLRAACDAWGCGPTPDPHFAENVVRFPS